MCRAFVIGRKLSTKHNRRLTNSIVLAVRAWNTATGKELFRMDGFTEAVQSLCLLDSVVRSPTSSAAAESLSKVGELTTASNTILLCDGMDKYVCVHDFSTNPDHDNDADFDLDMPEYLNE